MKNIVTDALSRFPLNRDQENTHNPTYKKEIVSEINYIEEISEVNLPIYLKIIAQY